MISTMNYIAGYKIRIKISPELVRKNEIISLVGSSKKLYGMIGKIEKKRLEEILEEMYYD